MTNQKKSPKKTKSKREDPFFRLQYIAFCRNYTTPADNGEFVDLVNFAKNYLCLSKNILYYDPIWQQYGDEELLVEYYSVRMHEDSNFREEIETRIKGKGNTVDDFLEWTNKREKEYNRERENAIKEAEFEFSPDEIKGKS